MTNGASAGVWDLIRDWVFLVLSVMGVLVMSLFRWNWGKLNSDIKKNQASIEALYEEKANKDDVERRHAENRADFAELKDNAKRADMIREDMWKALAGIDKNVGILLDRDQHKRNV